MTTSSRAPIRVEVYADISCPWCRLGHRKVLRAAVEVGPAVEVEVVHRAFQLDPDEPEQPRSVREQLGAKYGASKVDVLFTQMTALGREQGVEFRLDAARSVNTLRAHQLLWLAARDHGAAVQAALTTALFDAFFQHGANVADLDVLVGLAGEAGMDAARTRAALLAGEGRDVVQAEARAARARGITSVPTYVFPGGDVSTARPEVAALVERFRRAAAAR
jgi:predicted DsbA family dithiol-disulfide isomerase